MRFDQQKSACFRVARVAAALGVLSASGSGVFASGQAPVTPPVAAPPTARPPVSAPSQAAQSPQPGTSMIRISSEDAVKMALENNLGIRAEQLTPQIQTYAVAQARAAYAPSLFSTTTSRSSTTPPGNFLTGTGATLTNESLRTNAGLQQLVPWAGGRYSLAWDASKLTTSDASSRFNPQLDRAFRGRTPSRCSATSPSTARGRPCSSARACSRWPTSSCARRWSRRPARSATPTTTW